MSRFVDPYYVANSLLLLVLQPLHMYFTKITPEGSQYSKIHTLSDFYTWERQLVVTLIAVVAWKALRRRSWDHFAQAVFFWGKVITALTAVVIDLRLAIWYGLAVWAVCAVFPQPLVEMQVCGNVRALTPITMKDIGVLSDGTWLMYYYSEPHDESLAMAPAFVELADKYGGDRTQFGCLDVCLWPRFAQDVLKVSTSTWNNQLPTVVMYKAGKEVGRIPVATLADDWSYKRNYYTKRDVVRKFKLDADTPSVAQSKGKRQRHERLAVN